MRVNIKPWRQTLMETLRASSKAIHWERLKVYGAVKSSSLSTVQFPCETTWQSCRHYFISLFVSVVLYGKVFDCHILTSACVIGVGPDLTGDRGMVSSVLERVKAVADPGTLIISWLGLAPRPVRRSKNESCKTTNRF